MPDADGRILFLYGNDEFAIHQRLDEIQARLDEDGLNTARLEARTASPDDLNNALNAAPFLAERRLVFLGGPSARYTTPEARKEFLESIAHLPPTTHLALHEAIEPKEEARHWLVKAAEKSGFETARCMAPRQWEMAGWIVNETRAQGGAIEQGAAARLAGMVGEHNRQAAQEISKLLTYVDYARPITLADVEAVSVVSAQASVFALVDALAGGEGRAAQSLLHRLLEDEEPFALWGMVIRQFRLLILAREALDGRGTLQEAQQKIHEAAYSVEKAYKQAARFNMPALEAIYRRLLAMDEAAKTGEMPLEVALDLFVVELAKAG
ncbi:MAG: DNA polymerase III subunit delta [Chloroflexi bacterium]|nr:DNA polymerase III subunit delta [Chloroflexota bacterium]